MGYVGSRFQQCLGSRHQWYYSQLEREYMEPFYK